MFVDSQKKLMLHDTDLRTFNPSGLVVHQIVYDADFFSKNLSLKVGEKSATGIFAQSGFNRLTSSQRNLFYTPSLIYVAFGMIYYLELQVEFARDVDAFLKNLYNNKPVIREKSQCQHVT